MRLINYIYLKIIQFQIHINFTAYICGSQINMKIIIFQIHIIIKCGSKIDSHSKIND